MKGMIPQILRADVVVERVVLSQVYQPRPRSLEAASQYGVAINFLQETQLATLYKPQNNTRLTRAVVLTLKA